MNILTLPKRTAKWFRRMSELSGRMDQRLDQLQLAIGRIELRQAELANSDDLRANEFKVFSQSGEDGIVQFLIRNIPIPNRIFVEFGVHDYTESNTRFLLRNNNWAGLVMDSSESSVQSIQADPLFWMHNLKAECAFIDRDNINDLIRRNGIGGDIGLLSVDIDGNDYWVWEAIDCISPRIVICEYNSFFGPSKRVVCPYNKSHVLSEAHYSGLYWGASIGALQHLAARKGYSLAGSNAAGVNAFFVRDDIRGKLRGLQPEEAYVQTQFRSSRDLAGHLSYLDFEAAQRLLADMPLYEVDTGRTLRAGDLIA